MSIPLTIEEYSGKEFVVRGDSTSHKEALMSRHGRYNPNLLGGPGWVFSKRHLDNITSFISETSEMKEVDMSTSSYPSRKRKHLDLEQFKKKLRKIIKREVEQEVHEEFEEQKHFVLTQWRNELSKENKPTRIRYLCVMKQFLLLCMFTITCLVYFYLLQDGNKEYVFILWDNSTITSSYGVCYQVYIATIPSTEIITYEIFNHLPYPCL